jgi:hypothetical protein
VFLRPNVPKSRRNYEEKPTDKIVGNTNVQIYFVSLFESVDVRVFQAIEAYSSLDRTSEMYNTNRLSREEKLYVIKLMSPRSFESEKNI